MSLVKSVVSTFYAYSWYCINLNYFISILFKQSAPWLEFNYFDKQYNHPSVLKI